MTCSSMLVGLLEGQKDFISRLIIPRREPTHKPGSRLREHWGAGHTRPRYSVDICSITSYFVRWTLWFLWHVGPPAPPKISPRVNPPSYRARVGPSNLVPLALHFNLPPGPPRLNLANSLPNNAKVSKARQPRLRLLNCKIARPRRHHLVATTLLYHPPPQPTQDQEPLSDK